MSVPLLVPKPKATPSAVQGRITVVAEDGAKVGQWGGTECYLSRENGLGPCLVVTTIANKKRRTFFPLTRLHRVLSLHVNAGKLTVLMPHERRKMVSIFVETTSDVEELKLMAAVLQDRSLWSQMERNVSAAGKGGRATTTRGSGRGGGGISDRTDAYHEGIDGSREPLDMYGNDDGEDGDELEEEARNAAAIASLAQQAKHAQVQQQQQEPGGEDPVDLLTLAAAVDRENAAVEGRREDHDDDSVELGFASATRSERASGAVTGRACAVLSSSGGRYPLSGFASDCPQYALVTDAIAHGTNVFLTGPPGTGKTTFLRYLLHALQRQRMADRSSGTGTSLEVLAQRNIAVTAATGHAARFLGGTTLAFFTGVPPQGHVHDIDSLVDKILSHRSHRHILRAWLATDILIVDDTNQVPAHLFTLVSEVGKRVRHAAFLDGKATISGMGSGVTRTVEEQQLFLQKPFGGIQLVVVGDFMAAPPPPSRAGEEVLSAFASSAWPLCELQCIWLTPDLTGMQEQQQRQQSPEHAERLVAYQTFLENIREGNYTVAVDDVVVAATNNHRERYLAEYNAKRKGAYYASKNTRQQSILEPVTVVVSSEEADRLNARLLGEVLLHAQHDKPDKNAVKGTNANNNTYHHFTSEDYAAQPGTTDLDAEINLPSSLTLCRGAQVMLLSSPDAFLREEGGRSGGKDRKDVIPFSPSYGSVGVVVGFRDAGIGKGKKRGGGGGMEQALPVVRFFRPPYRLQRFHEHPTGNKTREGGTEEAADDDEFVDITVEPVSMQVWERHESTRHSSGGDEDEGQKHLFFSRTQLPLRLSFALPVAALTNVPSLPAVRLRVDGKFFSTAFATRSTTASTRLPDRDHDGEKRREERNDEEEEEASVNAEEEEEELMANQWGHIFSALSKVSTADALYLERFDRKLLRRAINADAKAFYLSLFPLSAEEEQARQDAWAAEKRILDERRRQRKREKGKERRALGPVEAHLSTISQVAESGRKRLREEGEEHSRDGVAVQTALQRSQPPEREATPSRSPPAAAVAGSLSPGVAATVQQQQQQDTNASSKGLPHERTDDDSLRMPMLTQDSMMSTVTDLVEASQVRAMVRGLLMDDDEE